MAERLRILDDLIADPAAGVVMDVGAADAHAIDPQEHGVGAIQLGLWGLGNFQLPQSGKIGDSHRLRALLLGAGRGKWAFSQPRRFMPGTEGRSTAIFFSFSPFRGGTYRSAPKGAKEEKGMVASQPQT